jgi:transcriptional regulator with XRE-family HTH domain
MRGTGPEADLVKYCAAVGAAVRYRREQLGLSQEELAHAADLHRTYVGGVERGERNPTIGSLRRIAAALSCTPAALLTDAERSLKASS